MNAAPALLNSKPHYAVLDGLRGVAAVLVVAFHLMEAHATGHFDQMINHGYLAVDFFFMLSGYVIGYAYDDRWGKMTLGAFFKRRIIRLQPMVIIGSVVGAACFYFQDSAMWPTIHEVPVWQVLLLMVVGATLLPVTLGMDIRGWTEMHPLNGPAWSLFYEYIGNILYALFVRRFSKTMLSILVFVAGAALVHYAVTNPGGDMVGGWSLTWEQLRVGFTRLCFPFFGGLLLSRLTRPADIKNAFLWCSLLLLAVLAMPRIGGADNVWVNGLYESAVIITVFPLIVWMGATGGSKSGPMARACKFLGDISYPIYITHYPLVYIYTGYVSNGKLPLGQTWGWALLMFVAASTLAYGSLKLWDEPVREWLRKKWK
ncbi:MAG: acyltransferase [Rikenellaceae bacterium]|jgi:peptidoglycan/LPS O-acetylase OafA/YrhL|nr:acyltransferase [Rikenellaceae bacterium]